MNAGPFLFVPSPAQPCTPQEVALSSAQPHPPKTSSDSMAQTQHHHSQEPQKQARRSASAETQKPERGHPRHSRKCQVLCIGDSLTAGGYPQHLQNLLQCQYTIGVKVVDAGLGGAGVLPRSAGSTYLSYLQNGACTHVSTSNVIVVMLGTNDAQHGLWSEERFVMDYKQLVRALQRNSLEEPAIILGIPPEVKHESFGPDFELVKHVLPRAVRRIALDLDLPIFNPRAALRKTQCYCSDGIHLSQDGAKALAGAIQDALEKEVSRVVQS